MRVRERTWLDSYRRWRKVREPRGVCRCRRFSASQCEKEQLTNFHEPDTRFNQYLNPQCCAVVDQRLNTEYASSVPFGLLYIILPTPYISFVSRRMYWCRGSQH